MSDIKNFTFAPGLELSVIDRNGEPWFVAADVCRSLGMGLAKGTSKYLESLDPDEVLPPEILGVTLPGRSRQALLINESGLYSLILRSRKPEAKAFKKWVTSEVLPTIRKTGGYMAPSVANMAETAPSPIGHPNLRPAPTQPPSGSPMRSPSALTAGST